MASCESDFDAALNRGAFMTVPSCALLQKEHRSLMRKAGTGSEDSTTRPNAGGDAERRRG